MNQGTKGQMVGGKEQPSQSVASSSSNFSSSLFSYVLGIQFCPRLLTSKAPQKAVFLGGGPLSQDSFIFLPLPSAACGLNPIIKEKLYLMRKWGEDRDEAGITVQKNRKMHFFA